MKKRPTKLRLVVVPDNPEYMIHVDREKIPLLPYLKGVGKVEWFYPGLQNVGPTDFDVSKLNRILNLQDGLAIKHKPGLFKKFFSGRRIPMGHSIVKDRFGNLFVPRLHEPRLHENETDNHLVIEWFHIGYECLNHPWLWVVRPNQ